MRHWSHSEGEFHCSSLSSASRSTRSSISARTASDVSMSTSPPLSVPRRGGTRPDQFRWPRFSTLGLLSGRSDLDVCRVHVLDVLAHLRLGELGVDRQVVDAETEHGDHEHAPPQPRCHFELQPTYWRMRA